jgi:hypothetical protein
MHRTFLVLALGIAMGVGGVVAAHHQDDGESVKLITARDIKEMWDGQDAMVTAVEVTIGPGPA